MDNFNVEMQLIHSDQISALLNSFFRIGIAGYHRPRAHAMSEQRPSNLQNILTTQLQCKTLCCKITSLSVENIGLLKVDQKTETKEQPFKLLHCPIFEMYFFIVLKYYKH